MSKDYKKIFDDCITTALDYIEQIEDVETKVTLSIELAKALSYSVSNERSNTSTISNASSNEVSKGKATTTPPLSNKKGDIITVTKSDGSKQEIIIDGFTIDENGVAVKDKNITPKQALNFNMYCASKEGKEAMTKYNKEKAKELVEEGDSIPEEKEVKVKEPTTKKEATTKQSKAKAKGQSKEETDKADNSKFEEKINNFVVEFEYNENEQSKKIIDTVFCNFTSELYQSLEDKDIPMETISAFIDEYISLINNSKARITQLIEYTSEDDVNYALNRYEYGEEYDVEDESIDHYTFNDIPDHLYYEYALNTEQVLAELYIDAYINNEDVSEDDRNEVAREVLKNSSITFADAFNESNKENAIALFDYIYCSEEA